MLEKISVLLWKKEVNYLLFNNFATDIASAIKKINNGTTSAMRSVWDKILFENTELWNINTNAPILKHISIKYAYPAWVGNLSATKATIP